MYMIRLGKISAVYLPWLVCWEGFNSRVEKRWISKQTCGLARIWTCILNGGWGTERVVDYTGHSRSDGYWHFDMVNSQHPTSSSLWCYSCSLWRKSLPGRRKSQMWNCNVLSALLQAQTSETVWHLVIDVPVEYSTVVMLNRQLLAIGESNCQAPIRHHVTTFTNATIQWPISGSWSNAYPRLDTVI